MLLLLPGLAAGRAVQVEDHVDAAPLRLGNRFVQVVPRIGAQTPRMPLVFHERVDERQAHHVYAELRELVPVGRLHPVVAKQLEQAVALRVAEALVQHPSSLHCVSTPFDPCPIIQNSLISQLPMLAPFRWISVPPAVTHFAPARGSSAPLA